MKSIRAWFPVAMLVAGTQMSLAQPNVSSTPPAPRPPAAPPADPGKPAELIPRSVIFGNPEKAGARISPDGTKLSFLAPVNGVLNIWVGPSGRIADARPVTTDTGRGIRIMQWAYTSQHVLYLQDTDGDENWRVYCTDIATGKTTNLTPMDNIAAEIAHVSDRFPDEIIVSINDRDPQYHDLYRINIRTAERTLLLKNDGYSGFTIDDDYRVRFAQKMIAGGAVEEYKAAIKDGQYVFELSETIPMEDSSAYGHVGFDRSGTVRYIRDSRGRDTAGIFAVNLDSGEKKLLFGHDRTDAEEVFIHPTEKVIQAVRFNYERPRWSLSDRSLERDWQFMAKNCGDGTLDVVARSQDDRIWIVTAAPDNASARTYLYDRGSLASDKIADSAGGPIGPKITLLFVSRPALQGRALASMQWHEIKSRDGLTLMSYLSLPPGADADKNRIPDSPLPMVLNVHGGPWARDEWGFEPEHQWLANRGYAVLSVNFRGSTGFGKKFVNASKGEWGGRMHDDLLDAVKWAVDRKIADPARIAIYGGSYGGYAALVGLTFTPETFACGVSIVGVSNLTTFMNTIPPYWEPFKNYLYEMVGNPTTEEGRQFLLSRSPITKVDQIKRPLLIAQGAMDPRVNKDESDQIVNAMKQHNIPVTYLLYPDEGHGFARPANRTSFYAVAEAFLAQHLGGRVEPIGDDFKGASLKVETGADQVPGLSEALTAGKQ
jgi:dipeptidyl aminopeptidase/acylaminoacyl peptidase